MARCTIVGAHGYALHTKQNLPDSRVLINIAKICPCILNVCDFPVLLAIHEHPILMLCYVFIQSVIFCMPYKNFKLTR